MRALQQRMTLVAFVGAVMAPQVHAQPVGAELTVEVNGVHEERGEIGCALFSQAEGFPMDTRRALQTWSPVRGTQATCVFKDVAPGAYAVSVVHDLNGNRRVDANMFGIPKEPWGVSKNVVHSMRAPTMDEARFEMTAAPQRLQIVLVR